MDLFKLAFETTIVGLLAFTWLGLAAYFLFPDSFTGLFNQKTGAFLKDNQAAVGAAILTLSYCLGSAILPISNQLVNDEHWPLNQDAIRCQVFTSPKVQMEVIHDPASARQDFHLEDLKPVHCSYWAPIFAKKIGKVERFRRFALLWVANPDLATNSYAGENDKEKADQILTIFQRQETAVLNQKSEETENLLRQLHERIVVLRGAVFSGFVLLLICLPAYFAPANGHASPWVRRVCGIVLALILMAFALRNGYDDFKQQNIFDIPVLESLLVVVTIFGAFVVLKRAKTPLFRTRRWMLIALFFTSLTYGGWMWSEVLYDQQIITSFDILQNSPTARQP
jgi:hypothetical protein